jgi:hypothetical protein
MPPDSQSLDYPLTLLCHPATPAPVVRTIEASATLRPDGSLALAYRLWGDMARLLIPEPHTPERTDSLWEHTCFEAFIGVAGSAAYREFNFSPSGQWAAYAFSGYREPDDAIAPISTPQITTRRFAGRLEIEALIAADALPPGGAWQIGLTAVVEAADTVDGSHSYWALHHPAQRPDFHLRDAFTLELAGLATPRNPA